MAKGSGGPRVMSFESALPNIYFIATVEFPMTAAVVPHSINDMMSSDAVLGGDVVIGGDVGW